MPYCCASFLRNNVGLLVVSQYITSRRPSLLCHYDYCSAPEIQSADISLYIYKRLQQITENDTLLTNRTQTIAPMRH